MAHDPLPRPIALLVAWALTDPDLSPVFGTRVSHRLPETVTYPHLTVTRVGGGRAGSEGPPIVDAFVQFDVWTGGDAAGHPDTVTAETHATLLEAVLAAVDNVTVAGEGVFRSFTVVNSRPFMDPDRVSGRWIVDGIATLTA